MTKTSDLNNLLKEVHTKLGDGEHNIMISSKKECLPIALYERSKITEFMSNEFSAMFNKQEKAYKEVCKNAVNIIITVELEKGRKYIGVNVGDYAIFGIFTNSGDTGVVKETLKKYAPKFKEILD